MRMWRWFRGVAVVVGGVAASCGATAAPERAAAAVSASGRPPPRATTRRPCRSRRSCFAGPAGGTHGGSGGRTRGAHELEREGVRGDAARSRGPGRRCVGRRSCRGCRGVAKYTRLSNFTSPSLSFYPRRRSRRSSDAGRSAACRNSSSQRPLAAFRLIVLRARQLAAPGHHHRPHQRLLPEHRPELHGGHALAGRGALGRRGGAGALRANGRVAYYTWLARAARSSSRCRRSTTRRRTCATRATSSPSATRRRPTSSARRRPSPPRSSRSSSAKNLADLAEKQLRVAIHAAGRRGRSCPARTSRRPCRAGAGQREADDDGGAEHPARGQERRRERRIGASSSRPRRRRGSGRRSARSPTASRATRTRASIPPSNVWFGTWDVGAQLTWSPNDVARRERHRERPPRRARRPSMANKNRHARQHRGRGHPDAAGRARGRLLHRRRARASSRAPTEAYRVARELFNNGRGHVDDAGRRRDRSDTRAARPAQREGRDARTRGSVSSTRSGETRRQSLRRPTYCVPLLMKSWLLPVKAKTLVKDPVPK